MDEEDDEEIADDEGPDLPLEGLDHLLERVDGDIVQLHEPPGGHDLYLHTREGFCVVGRCGGEVWWWNGRVW